VCVMWVFVMCGMCECIFMCVHLCGDCVGMCIICVCGVGVVCVVSVCVWGRCVWFVVFVLLVSLCVFDCEDCVFCL